MPTPNDIQVAINVRQQSRRINERLNRQGIPTNARRSAVRAKGYRGPLTRAELANLRKVN